MAASKSSAKGAPTKRAASATAVDTGKPKLTAKAKLAVKAAPAKKSGGTVKTVAKTAAKAAPKTAPKAVPKAAPKPRAKKPGGAAPRQPSTVPAEQRRNYVEMAAYYIAERRGFAPGNPLEDWVQAEAEIDRLLAEGRLGG
jgi:hypothetical protein